MMDCDWVKKIFLLQAFVVVSTLLWLPRQNCGVTHLYLDRLSQLFLCGCIIKRSNFWQEAAEAIRYYRRKKAIIII